MTVCRMTRSKVKGHRGPKVAKMADFKVCFRQYAIKRLLMDYDTARQYLIFSGQIFDIHSRSASHDLHRLQ